MKSLRHIFLCSIFFFNNAPIASEVDNSYQKQSLLAVLYKRTSAEYKANTFQVYSSAKNNIDKALQDKSWTALLNQDKDYQNLPPAVILDIDETVLDNSFYNARNIIDETNYPENWSDWVFEENAKKIPGSLEFLKIAQSYGIKIFYVTNRAAEYETATRNNLKKLNYLIIGDKPTKRKIDTAKELNVKILNQSDWLKMLNKTS